MIPPAKPDNEEERLASLERMNLLSTAREADFDRIARIAQRLFGTDIALVSLIDKDRQWFKARFGLDAPETPRDESFCGHAILGDETFVVPDAAKDERFFDNPLVTGGPRIRFYAGHPLLNSDGYPIGTLCVISPTPRGFSDEEKAMLEDLAGMVELVLANRQLSETQSSLAAALLASERDKLIDPLSGLWNRRGMEELFERELARAIRERESFVVAMGDIDHFKSINDRFGHATGDEAIKLAAELLLQACRGTDLVARIGGEEFAILAPHVPPAVAPTLGEKLLRAFRSRARLDTAAGSHAFTISAGMVVAQPHKGGPELLNKILAVADEALYRAKHGGRDRYELVGFPEGFYADAAIV